MDSYSKNWETKRLVEGSNLVHEVGYPLVSECILDSGYSRILEQLVIIGSCTSPSCSRMTDKLFSQKIDGFRVFMIYVDDVPLAGAVFIDEWVTSEYWASFYHEDARQYHLGIAMMDAWYLDSYQKWIRYCDLDHMRDSGQLSSYAGYTEFKSSIADHDVYFHDMWIRIF